MSAIRPRFTASLLRVGVIALVLGSVLATPAQAAPATQQVARKDVLVIPSMTNIPAPDIWNPYIPGTYILQGMNQNMMEPLFMLNYETGAIDGWLAESYSNNLEMTEWFVTLRQGTEWSDGRPLTSEDVVFTINLLKQYAPQLNWSGAVQRWVQTAEVVDDRTIRFTLTAPNPRFVLENLAGTTSQAIVPLPKHVWEGQDPVTFRNPYNAATGAPIFSGPYTVARFSSTEFVYKRNDNWWGAKTGTFRLPPPLEIRRPWVGDVATINQMAVNNEADVGDPRQPSVMFAMMAQNPNLLPYTTDPPYAWIDPCPRMLTLNHTVAPWDRKEMRWALSYAMDRQQIVDVVLEGAGVPSTFIFPSYPAMQPYLDAAKPILDPIGEFNLDKSSQLFQSQGYTLGGAGMWVGPDGNTLSLDVVAPPFMEPYARIVVQQLNTGGVDAVLRIQEWGAFRDQTGRGHFQAATDWDGCGSTVEPWFGMNRFNKSWVNPIGTPGTEYVDNTNNAGRWVNDEYSAIMDELGTLPIGDPRVMDLYLRAVAIYADEMPDIPLVQTPSFVLWNTTYWTGFPTKTNNYVQPPSHWQHFLRTLTQLQPTQ